MADGATAAWAQPYLRDVSTVAEERFRQNRDLDWSIIKRLSQELHSCGNPFINHFKHAYERLIDEGRTHPDPLAVLQIDLCIQNSLQGVILEVKTCQLLRRWQVSYSRYQLMLAGSFTKIHK
jgi:hypothetical protein